MFIQRIRNVVFCSLIAIGAAAAPAQAAPFQNPGGKIEVKVACTPMGNTGQGKIDHEHKVNIKVTDANGNEHDISGEIHRSGTAGALCRDIKGSLVAAGANAADVKYGPKNPGETDPKKREATYELELPPGWTANPTTEVQKKTSSDGQKPKWKTCSKNSHLSVKVLAALLPGGSGNVAYIGSGQSHSFPVAVALEIRRPSADGDGTEPIVLFSGEFQSSAGGPGAMIELAQALQEIGLLCYAAADEETQTQGLIIVDPTGQPFHDVGFVAGYGEGEDGDLGTDEVWAEIRSTSFVY